MDARLGMTFLFAGDYAPQYFELCRGQELPIFQWTALYSVIGDRYGGDQKKNTFNLPNLEGPESLGTKTRLNYIICIMGDYPMKT
jgi:microcystin-dependent protein